MSDPTPRPGRSLGPSGDAPGPRLYRIGTIAGSQVLLSPTAFIYMAFIAILLAPVIEQSVPGLGAGKYVAGLAVGVLFYLSILVHEASHAVVAQHYGYRVPAITVHFLGAMTTVEGESRTARQEFAIAVVGPVASLALGLVGLGLAQVGLPDLLQVAVQGLAISNLAVGILNLVPGLPLDGGRLLSAAVWGATGNRHRGTMVAGWGGRVVAVLVLLWPIAAIVRGSGVNPTQVIVAVVLAAFLWRAATVAMASARWRSRLPVLAARDLLRFAAEVAPETSVAEAVRRAAPTSPRRPGSSSDADADADIVTVSADGRPTGLVDRAALTAVPPDQLNDVPVASVARSLEPGLLLQVDLRGEDLVRAMSRAPAEVYVVVDDQGALAGVLHAADVDEAFRSAGQR